MQASRRGGRLKGGTGPAFLATAGAVLRAVPAREGAGPGPVSPPAPPSHLDPGSGFGRRLVRPQAGAFRAGGVASGDGRRVVHTKCIRSNFDSSGRLRGGGFSPTASSPSRGQRAAPAARPPSRRGPRPPSSPAGRAGTFGRQPSSTALVRPGGWWVGVHLTRRAARPAAASACAGSWGARAPADDLAAGLAAGRVCDCVDELAWAMPAQPATSAGSPAFPAWSRARPDPSFKPRLPCSLATPLRTRRATALLDAGATHCCILARLAATPGPPPSARPGPAAVTAAAPGRSHAPRGAPGLPDG